MRGSTATKIIVSYDGTDNDHDALALGDLLARAGGTLELAYVRHAQESEPDRETLARDEAEALLQGGAEWLAQPDVPRHVVLNASTPEGLAALAGQVEAEVVVFGSAYRTAPGHVAPQASAWRLLEGGPVAVAVAPAGLHHRPDPTVGTIAAIGEEGDAGFRKTAETLASRFGATVVSRPSDEVDLAVIGSKLRTPPGVVRISAAAQYLVETMRCPVLVVPRAVVLTFGG